MARSNTCLPIVVRRQDRGRRSTSRTSRAASSAASLRLTVAWSTFRQPAAPESVPLCATARKCRMSSQSTICAKSQGSLAYIPNFRTECSWVFSRHGDAKEDRTPCQDGAALGGIAGVGGGHGDLDGGRTHRDFYDDGILVEIDFVAAAIGAAQDGDHAFLHAMRMTKPSH